MTAREAYEAAKEADAIYSNAIRGYAPGKDRWTLTKEEAAHPVIRSAYEMKVEADNEFWRLADAARAEKGGSS